MYSFWQDKMPPGLRFSILDRTFKQQMDEHAKQLGLTFVQLRVLGEIRLMEIGNLYKEINQKDLEKIEHVTHPTMTRILQQLESKSFIKCSTSKIDQRYKKIVSTKKAETIPEFIEEKETITLDELTKGLSEQDLQELIRITDVILDNINKNIHE